MTQRVLCNRYTGQRPIRPRTGARLLARDSNMRRPLVDAPVEIGKAWREALAAVTAGLEKPDSTVG
jgi:hypothetical protein